MKPIPYIDRTTKKICLEKVYGGKAVAFLYGGSWLGNLLKSLFSKNAFMSSFMGYFHKQPSSKKRIAPFIAEYDVDAEEFLLSPEDFKSFNDFFIRQLKPEARPIDSSDAIIPADARYWFYDQVEKNSDFLIKGERLNRQDLLGDTEKAKLFENGSVAIARLCPSDYHRFHFPFDCIPSAPHLINGPLFSVNPMAIKQNVAHLTQNKRKVTYLESELFGQVAYIEIGATSVGTIQETFIPNVKALKGQEKGYFEFGGSALIILFQPNSISFSQDLLDATKQGYEIRCLMGQKMGLSRLSKEK